MANDFLMRIPDDPPRPADLGTVADAFREIAAPLGDYTEKLRRAFFYGASSALICLAKGAPRRVFDARKFQLTFIEAQTYLQPQSDTAVKPVPDEVRETTLAREWELGNLSREREQEEAFYAGAMCLTTLLLDRDAPRVNVVKVPFLVEEVREWIDGELPSTGGLLMARITPSTGDRAAQIARDLTFMKLPAEWPLRPVLPLKKRDGQMSDDDYCGLLYSDGRPVVYVGFAFLSGERSWPEYLETLEARTFSTLEALAEVWAVD